MFDSLSDKLQGVFRKLGSHGTVTEKDLDEALREVRLALLEADVNYKVVKEFVAAVRENAIGADVLKSLTPMQQIIDVVNKQLVELLGGGQAKLERAKNPPTVIMLVGLKGAGKTTTAAKLGLHLRHAGERPLLVGADPERVAGSEQLQSLGKQLSMPVITGEANANPVDVCKRALKEAKKTSASYIIVDTVGQLDMDDDDRSGLRKLHKVLDPTEVILVADAMTGQEAVNAAEQFNETIPLTGLILTKVDGDARGGAALSIRAVTGVPIKFFGMGEKADALEPFYPERFASRILGMGDLLTLIDKAKEQISEEEAESLGERLKTGELTLDDFLEQYQRIKNMGPLSNLVSLLPGLSQIKNRLNLDDMNEDYFAQVEAIIRSMTKSERKEPAIIDGSRRKRIADGSGTKPQDVNRVLKQFKEAKKIMQQIAAGHGSKTLPFLR
ncbi:MAG: signal recognition particle protein [Chloroflexi bacterium]|nr:signal recognition particle protein [Chloroflexota bacterium]MCI0814388.1 signal recognition particle protein [Chloroflexota bacterium]MCI0820377.1 signal recognition particle protein [Chloroflexota bacterium]MCI0831432.1 signal recognition particle protein [Chloroflexota bacterium]MCI0839788.1 signal recognition particle protein [Chloroflexota bacterium]